METLRVADKRTLRSARAHVAGVAELRLLSDARPQRRAYAVHEERRRSGSAGLAVGPRQLRGDGRRSPQRTRRFVRGRRAACRGSQAMAVAAALRNGDPRAGPDVGIVAARRQILDAEMATGKRAARLARVGAVGRVASRRRCTAAWPASPTRRSTRRCASISRRRTRRRTRAPRSTSCTASRRGTTPRRRAPPIRCSRAAARGDTVARPGRAPRRRRDGEARDRRPRAARATRSGCSSRSSSRGAPICGRGSSTRTSRTPPTARLIAARDSDRIQGRRRSDRATEGCWQGDDCREARSVALSRVMAHPIRSSRMTHPIMIGNGAIRTRRARRYASGSPRCASCRG